MKREQRAGSYLVLVAVLLGLILATWFLWSVDFESEPARIPPAIQAYVTSFILLATGIFAAARFELFRNFIPHIAVEQKVTHRPISDGYVYILVTTILHNRSKVKADFAEGLCTLQRLGPISDAEVEDIYRQKFSEVGAPASRTFQWVTLESEPISWNGMGLTVEPGGVHQENCEFIISADVTSILAHTYFSGLNTPTVPGSWGVTTVHDMISLEQANEVLHED
ncbi:MAG: hypothetical protein OXR67_06930 [Chloroflexota bacterium]|nr:hypothetical protein [Chloroflexota bacterium]